MSLSRERVFEAYLDAYRRVPEMFPDRLRSMTLVRHEGNERDFECNEVWAGRSFVYKMRERLQPPLASEQIITEGKGRGIRSRFTFEPTAGGGTSVRMDWEWKGVAGLVIGRLMKKEFQREFGEVLARYLKAIEAGA